MGDFNSSLPVRTQTPGDIQAIMVDYTNPTTQGAKVDTHGSQYMVIADASGNAIGDQSLGGSYWLQVVVAGNGPAAPGTASAYSVLAGGIYNSTPETLTTGQQSALQLTSSGALIVSATLPYDTNYGTVGANTLRTASQIGNATGAADFGAGATDAQTLRVTANQGVGGAATPWTVNLNQVGGTAFALGQGLMAASISVAIASNQSAIPVTQSTSPWITKDQSDGPVTPGTVAAFSQLAGGQYNSTLPTLTTTQQSAIQLDSSGRLIISPLTSASVVTVSNLPTTVDTNYGTVGASTIRTASQIGNATGAADFGNGATDAQTLRVAANLAVAGANVSSTNPVPVYITSSSPGTLVNSYYTSVNVAAGASVNLTYTIPAGKTFSAYKFWMSGSGKIRGDIESSPDGSTYSTYWTGFNSTANPNIDINLDQPAEFQDSGSGSTIRFVITNKDLAAFDVFATLTGTYQ